jgi:hypothetical protein
MIQLVLENDREHLALRLYDQSLAANVEALHFNFLEALHVEKLSR